MAYLYPFKFENSLYSLLTSYSRVNDPFDYTPPVGGYVNYDETEWDNTVWNDTQLAKPSWADITNEWSHDIGYEKLTLSTLYNNPTFVSDTQTAMAGKSNKADFAALDDVEAHGITSASANAVTNAPTELDPITTLLGTLTQELNETNDRYNALADKHNDLAGKFNDLLGKVSVLETAINNLKAAGAGE